MKVIDLLNKIANGEEMPQRVKISDNYYHFDISDSDYYNDVDNKATLMENIYLHNAYVWFNLEAEIFDDEEDKDIPFISDDELWSINGKKGIIEDANTYSEISRDTAINYNFKVLKEKINQVAEELNRRNNE